MTVKLGYRVGNNASGIDTYPQLYSRTTSTEGITTVENYVRATAPDMPNYRAGANRGSYMSFSETWPDNSEDARWQNDIDEGRMIVFTAGAGENPSNAQIDARGDELAGFLSDNAGNYESVVMSYHHEPNGNVSPTTWWTRMQNIVTRWDARGVPRWEGTQDGVTTSPGVIYAGPNLAGLTFTDGATDGTSLLNTWYPTSNTWAWSEDGIQMACFDIYPGASGANGLGRWRGLPELFGVAGGPATGTSEFIQWYEPRRDDQNDDGRVLLAGCFEWGWDPWNKLKNNGNRYYRDEPGTTGNPSPSIWWNNNVGTYPPTFRQGLENFAEYLTDNPDLFYVICYWDSTAGDSTRGPHMLDVGEPGQPTSIGSTPLATQTEMWDAWLDFLRTPIFGHVEEAPVAATSGFGALL